MNIFIKIFHILLLFLSKISGKKLIYASFESLKQHDTMAVYDPIGFWYVGNLYNTSDIVYGIANQSVIKNEWEFVKNIFDQIYKDGQRVFYDIGANTGYFWILALSLPGKNVVTHFFEPLSEHTDCIKKSIYLNRFDNNAFIHQIGLSNENTTKTFYIAWSGSSLLSGFTGTGVTGTCTIEVKKLSDYQKIKNMNLPDFVKIDVEWNEYDVIIGGLEVFEESKPVLYVEIAKDLKNIGRDFINPHFAEIFSSIESIGYQSFRVSDDYKRVSPFVIGQEDSGVHMFLFLHPDTHSNLIEKYANK